MISYYIISYYIILYYIKLYSILLNYIIFISDLSEVNFVTTTRLLPRYFWTMEI
jgi:hypothetical protein